MQKYDPNNLSGPHLAASSIIFQKKHNKPLRAKLRDSLQHQNVQNWLHSDGLHEHFQEIYFQQSHAILSTNMLPNGNLLDSSHDVDMVSLKLCATDVDVFQGVVVIVGPSGYGQGVDICGCIPPSVCFHCAMVL